MKVNVSTVLKNYDGEDLRIKDSEEAPERGYTVRDAIIQSLNAQFPNEELTGEQRLNMFDISLSVKKLSSVDLRADDVVLIKERAVKALSTIAYGRLINEIDPKAKAE